MDTNRIADEYDRIRVIWTDLNGIPRGSSLPAREYVQLRDEGIGFASGIAELTLQPDLLESSTYGPEDGDILAFPGATQPKSIGWRDGVGAAFADLTHVDGTSFELCSRTVLNRVLDRYEAAGYTPRVGIELEFSLLRPTEEGGYEPFTDRSSYDMDALDQASDLTGMWGEMMTAAGFETADVHTESQPGQYEITLKHGGAETVADGVMFFRHMIRSVSRKNGLKASMMPSPYTGADANGMHVHISLWDDAVETNRFVGEATDLQFPSGTQPVDGSGISADALYFVGGLLNHADALAGICAPTVNSYTRLQPGSWAPVNVAWGPDNRSTVVRIPPHLGSATRVEFRLPDTASNPYLALAATLVAGLDGIREGTKPPEPTHNNAHGEDHERLPRTLWGALNCLEADGTLSDGLGSSLVRSFLEIKRDEFDRYQRTVSEWEREEYINAF
jgi:glutamine synthetase